MTADPPLMIERAFVGYKLAAGKLFVRVCASCPDKASLEAWCEAKGTAMTHTLCPACYQTQLAALSL